MTSKLTLPCDLEVGCGLTVTGDLNAPHAASHENGGADEISVAGLSGDLADAQDPKAHAASHRSGGADAIKLDDLAAPDDNTDLDVSTTKHGLCPKLDNDPDHFLDGQGAWSEAGGAHPDEIQCTDPSGMSDTWKTYIMVYGGG